MKKVITAIGNEKINTELKKEKNIEIVTNDIQYKEGILEALEIYEDIDYLILNSLLQGNINIEELIIEINIINKNIKIIIILENKNDELEKRLIEKNIYKILYNNEIEISELIKIILDDNPYNEELKEEINKLKKIILEKERLKKEKFFQKINNNLRNKKSNLLNSKLQEEKNKRNVLKNKKRKIINNIEKNIQKNICIIGPGGVGKSIISINLAKSFMYSDNKILIIDFDFLNNSIQTILGLKNNSKINNNNSNIKDNIEKNLEYLIYKNIIKINKKIDLLVINNELINYITKNKKEQKNNEFNYFIEIKEILNTLKNYNYILIDTNANEIELNKAIIELCNKTVLISGTNLLEINKSIKLLDKYINKYNINKNNFTILFNKYNSYSIDLKLLFNIFSEFKIMGYLKYNEKYNQLINKNNKINFIDKKIRKEYLKINNYLIN